MVPLSRGASFGADAECMSYFKAERTMASLNLFPRSEITKKKKRISKVIFTDNYI